MAAGSAGAPPALDVPLWRTLRRGWSFLSGLPSGGMAARDKQADQLILLDAALEPTTAVTIDGLGSVWDLGVSVCEEAGLVAVNFADGLQVHDLATGRQVYRITHPQWPVSSCSAWTSSGGLLWTVLPTDTRGVDEVVAIDPGTWTIAGRTAVEVLNSNPACYWMLPVPAADQVGVLGCLADSDGFYLLWPRWAGQAVVAPAKPVYGYQLADLSPDGRQFLAVTDVNELEVLDITAGNLTESLDMNELAGTDDAEDTWASDAYWLDADHVIARTTECHLLLLRPRPLNAVAQLSLEGYRYTPFDGRLIDTGYPDPDLLPLLTGVQRWTNRRLVTSHREDDVWVNRIYDLSLCL